ncbi:unnamed protein product [Sympodiomycopsis kandeliae]
MANDRSASPATPPLPGPAESPSSSSKAIESPLAEEVASLINQVKENPKDSTPFSNLIPAALELVKVKHADKPKHFFCSKHGEPDRNLQACMLRVLSFKPGPEIQEWLDMLGKCLYTCSQCYKDYLVTKQTVLPAYLTGFSEAQIEKFLAFIDAWEEKLAGDLFTSRNVKSGQGLGFLSPSELYAVLTIASLRPSIRLTVIDALTLHKLSVTLREANPGILRLAIDSNEKARAWAEMQALQSPKATPLDSQLYMSRPVQKIMQQYKAELTAGTSSARAKELWKAARVIAQSAPKALSEISSIVLGHLSDTNGVVDHVLHCFHKLLVINGSAVWRDAAKDDPEYPLVTIQSVLDNPDFIQGISNAETDSLPVWSDWMFSILSCVQQAPESAPGNTSSGASTPQRQETPSTSYSNQYGEILKRIIHLLFERLQHGHVKSRQLLLDLGISILTDAFASISDLASPQFQTITSVIGLYARTLSAFAFRGSSPNSATKTDARHPSRQKARELIQLMFEADQAIVADSIRHLSEITQSHLLKWRQRRKPGQPNAEEIYTLAAKEVYPAPTIGNELWSNAYQSFNPSGNTQEAVDSVAVFLKPLSRLTLFGEPNISTHLLPLSSKSEDESKVYGEYKNAVKSSIVAISRRLRAMRGELPMLLNELAEADMSTNQTHLREQCVHVAEELMLLNLSPVPDIHKAAQSIVRTAHADVESRGDVFKTLLTGSTASLRGFELSLDLFVQTCNELVEANDAAKWMVRSGADILDVLCNRTSGLLRPGAEGSLVDRDIDTRQVLEELLPSIWEMMSKSVAVIFQKTPKWSEHIAKEDMVAWFRDVTIFASQMVEQVETVTKAANARRRAERKPGQAMSSEEEDEMHEFLVSCLALPLEQAMSWLRINDLEIVGETMSYIVRALSCFKKEVELPQRVADKMLKFIKEQLDIDNPHDRKTLLSTSELVDLQARLDPNVEAIVISDEEDDEKKVLPPPSSNSWLASMTSPQKSTDSQAEKSRKKKLKQQKLSFSRQDAIDVDALPSAPAKTLQSSVNQASASKLLSAASNQSSVNKYKSASAAGAPAKAASSTTKRSVPAKPTNANMAALRKEFAASRNFAPSMNVNRRPPIRANNATEMREPRAPLAVSSVTGAAAGKLPSQRGAQKSSTRTNDSDSSSDDDDDGAPKGLAALAAARQSASKGKGPMNGAPPPQPRRTKLLDDGAIEKARKERQEAERKRMLRQVVDLGPLLQSILGWNWYHEGEFPPPSRSVPEPKYLPIPARFKNADEYGGIFGPLLMLESWAQFCSSKEDYQRGSVHMYTCEIQGRVSVDSFTDISATMTSSTPVTFRLGETDIVLLRQRTDGSDTANRPSKPRMFLAKVEQFKMNKSASSLTLRCMLENDEQGLSSQLVNRSIWDIGMLFSLNTVSREFSALLTAQYYDLARDIFFARVAQRATLSSESIEGMKRTYGVNEPQAEAILGALSADGFSLVQGPPGTGKTKTICAMVAHFVATRKTPANIGAGGRSVTAAVPKKILICAPSNAAIDEVARRAKLGMKGPDGKHIKVNVVRIGRTDAINMAARDIALDHLMEAALAKSAGEGGGDGNVDQLQAELRALRDERERKQAELDESRKGANSARVQHLEVELRTITAKRMTVSQKLDDARDKRQTAFRQREADRKRVRQEILLNADVICSTLSGAGHEALASLPIDFETVIIDEAAQAVELSTLVPLRYGAKRCIMVGDPKQLPPTVLSGKAQKLKYSQSLFVRLYEQAKQNVYLLSIQYRMHPEISRHPSKTFYADQLKDGPGMAELTAQPWHSDFLLKPFCFFSVRGQERSSGGHSFINTDEASTAVSIYDRLRRAAISTNFDGRIGCVTMYKNQVQELKRVFQARYGHDIDQRIDFNTVDGFQGQEKDIIILSCVRSGERGLGFLTDERRVNVAVTRAKSNLFIIGNAEGLRNASAQDGLWRALVDQSEANGNLRPVQKGTFSVPVGAKGNIPNGPSAMRKNGRARPEGWTSLANNNTTGNSSREGTPSSAGTKRLASELEEGEVTPTPKKARDEAGPTHSSNTASPRPPPTMLKGLQTMRPGSVRPPTTGPTGPVKLPPGLQTRRPGDVASRPPPGPAPEQPRPPRGPPPRHSGPAANNKPKVFASGKPNGGALARPPQIGQNGNNMARGPPNARPPHLANRPPGPPSHRPAPRPPSGPNNNNNQGAGAPSTAALDAVFVKRRKR